MGTQTVVTGTVKVNGAELYYEVRGNGPSVLLIPPGAGEAGVFEKFAEELADEFTVLTYDPRGHSRSPRPEGWATTSVEEQADDAAGLIQALGLAPAAVFGSSNGAVVALDLVLHHPTALRGALVHEPPIVGVLPNAAEVGAQLQAMVEEGFAKGGGPPAAFDHFIRTIQGDDLVDSLDPHLMERARGNAELLFSVELPAFSSYVPDGEALGAAPCPVIPILGADSGGSFFEGTVRWVAERVGTEVVEIPGAHGGYMNQPKEVAAVLRTILRKLR